MYNDSKRSIVLFSLSSTVCVFIFCTKYFIFDVLFVVLALFFCFGHVGAHTHAYKSCLLTEIFSVSGRTISLFFDDIIRISRIVNKIFLPIFTSAFQRSNGLFIIDSLYTLGNTGLNMIYISFVSLLLIFIFRL